MASGSIRQIASYQVHPEDLDVVLAVVRQFVAYVRANEPGTLTYDVWQEQGEPTRFSHLFVFRDEAAHHLHSSSAEVKAFAAVLYPRCLAPVNFVDFDLVATNRP